MGIALRLAKAGYWGGDPGRILAAPADQVVAAFGYEVFCGEYETAVYEMNAEG